MKDYIDNINNGTVNIIMGTAASGKSRISSAICKYHLLKNNNCVVINMPHIEECENLIKLSIYYSDEIIEAIKDIKNSIIFIDDMLLPYYKNRDFFNYIRILGDINNTTFVITLQSYRSPFTEDINPFTEVLGGGSFPMYVSDSIIRCYKDNDVSFNIIKSRFGNNGKFSIGDFDILSRKSRIANIYE